MTILMRAPTPFFLLLLFISCLYVGLIAFFPSLRSSNSRKKREPVTKVRGVVYISIGVIGLIYTLYVIYVFCGGSCIILPVSDKMLFRSADAIFFLLIIGSIIIGAIRQKLIKKIKPNGSK